MQNTRKARKIKPANKKSSPKADLTGEKLQAADREKSTAQKGRRKCADLKGQITVGYSV